MKLTPRAKTVLAAAAKLADERGHSWIGVEHLLLALTLKPHGVAAGVLSSVGATDAIREQLVELFDSPDYGSAAASRIVVDWEGNRYGRFELDEATGDVVIVDDSGGILPPPPRP